MNLPWTSLYIPWPTSWLACVNDRARVLSCASDGWPLRFCGVAPHRGACACMWMYDVRLIDGLRFSCQHRNHRIDQLRDATCHPAHRKCTHTHTYVLANIRYRSPFLHSNRCFETLMYFVPARRHPMRQDVSLRAIKTYVLHANGQCIEIEYWLILRLVCKQMNKKNMFFYLCFTASKKFSSNLINQAKGARYLVWPILNFRSFNISSMLFYFLSSLLHRKMHLYLSTDTNRVPYDTG